MEKLFLGTHYRFQKVEKYLGTILLVDLLGYRDNHTVVDLANLQRQREEKRNSGKRGNGLHLLVPSFDGHIYFFDGLQTLSERIDVGIIYMHISSC